MPSFSFLSTYPPTRCGLATFTQALATAMVGQDGARARIVRAMDDDDAPAIASIVSRSTIVGELRRGDSVSGRDAARTLSSSDAVIVQHEYGIYGGRDGDEILPVLAALTAPSIVVLHTVLPAPTRHQREVLENVTRLVGAVVVMTDTARRLLADHYSVDGRKVSVIPHGVADWTSVTVAPHPDRRTMLTWGLIGPGKGIECGIRAMAELVVTEPLLHYVVAGQTHPKVVDREGERYRESLQTLIGDLGLDDRVTLDARYLDAAQLAAHVAGADIVLLPYDTREQVTSGVLAEAVAAGKDVVATAFPHSIELLANGAGTLVEHEDPAAIAHAVRTLLRRGASAGHHRPPAVDVSWPAVAAEYRLLARSIRAERSA
ncbi:MAG TPA: glycosyltransferase [Pseudolysinimonas sp.]|nr:glycosyltransferase [Pseudolysinimonas sp.]